MLVKMAKKTNEQEEFEETFEDEETDFEQEEEEAVQIKKAVNNPARRPLAPPIEVNRTNKFAPQPKPAPENRFVAFHSPQIDGIMDTATNKLFSQDIMEVLADLKSQLNRIEESLG